MDGWFSTATPLSWRTVEIRTSVTICSKYFEGSNQDSNQERGHNHVIVICAYGQLLDIECLIYVGFAQVDANI